jgi:hypothetical protein
MCKTGGQLVLHILHFNCNIPQCWYDEMAALAIFLLQAFEAHKWILQDNWFQHKSSSKEKEDDKRLVWVA